MEKQTGCVHIYCGDGKGKTTCGMGLCTRAAGYGYRVLIYQFMKDNSTSERKVLLLSPNVTFVPGQDKIKFSFLMTPEEKAEQKRYYEEQFQKVTEKAIQEEYDVLFLDELVYTIGSKLFDEQLLLDFLDHKPEKLEVILTGQGPSEALIERADYVSELKKIKHPFDKGLAAITRNLVHHGFWFIARKNKKKDTVLHGIIFPAKQYLFSCFFSVTARFHLLPQDPCQTDA